MTNSRDPGMDFGKDDWQPRRREAKEKKESEPTKKWAEMDTSEKMGYVLAWLISCGVCILLVILLIKLIWVVIVA